MDESSFNDQIPPQDVSSPLRSMAKTSQTLGVKQSHLGVDLSCYPDNILMVREYNKLARPSSHSQVNEIVQYPPDIISTSVERSSSSNWGYDHYGPALLVRNKPKSHHDHKPRLRRTSNASNSTINSSYLSEEYDGLSHDTQNTHEFGSVSNISEYTTVDIMKEDKSVGTQSVATINEYVQTLSFTPLSPGGESFELKRMNANLKGQVEQLDQVMEEMVRERSSLQMRIHSLEKENNMKNSQLEQVSLQKDEMMMTNEELKSSINKWESIVGEYQEVIEAKTNEVKACNDDMKHLGIKYESSQVDVEHLKIDLESKCNTVKEMQKKLEEMGCELKNVFQSKINVEEELKKWKNDCESLAVKNNWYEGEINKIQIKLNEKQHQLVKEQEESIKARGAREKCLIENSLLKQQLIEVKHKTMREKEILMKNLEGIGNDLLKKELEDDLNKNEVLRQISSQDELNVKQLSEKLNGAEKQVQALQAELNQVKKTNEKLEQDFSINSKELEKVEKRFREKEFEANSLDSIKSDLEIKIKGLHIDLKRQREFNELLRKDKKESEEKVASLSYDNKSLESASRQLKETIERHERQLKQLQSNLVAKETKISLVEQEKSKLSNIVFMKDQEINQFMNANTESKMMNNESDMSLRELQIQKNELEKVVNALNTEVRSMHNKFEQEKKELTSKHDLLVDELNKERNMSLNMSSHIETLSKQHENLIASSKLMEQERNELEKRLTGRKYAELNGFKEDEVDNLQHAAMIAAKDERIRRLESNIKLLTRKYKESIKQNEEVKCLNEAIPVPISLTFASTQTDDDGLKHEQLEQELNKIKESLAEKEAIINENQKVILYLEHEKGKLVRGDENSAKQHITSLEALVNSKSEEIAELNGKVQDANSRYKELETKMNKKLAELEVDLKKERAIVKDLRHSVFSEKRENSYHKRDLNELKKLLSDSNLIADKRKQEVIDMEIILQKQYEIENGLKAEIERINTDHKYAREEIAKLKEMTEESSRKSEPLMEQLKNYSLNLMEKNQEINALKLTMSSMQDRNEIEMNGLKKLVDDYKHDIQSLNTDLVEHRREKLGLQSKLAEMKVALKNSHEINKRYKDQLKSCEISVSQVNALDEELINKLLTQTNQSFMEKKSLNNLQSCLESLKQEMEVLQQQIIP